MAAFVYVIQADNGEVKVGWSSTPYARLSKIKREYGARRGFREASLIGFIATPAFFEAELVAIRSLLPHAVGGEWFRVSADAAVCAVVDAVRQFDQEAVWRPPEPPRQRKMAKA